MTTRLPTLVCQRCWLAIRPTAEQRRTLMRRALAGLPLLLVHVCRNDDGRLGTGACVPRAQSRFAPRRD